MTMLHADTSTVPAPVMGGRNDIGIVAPLQSGDRVRVGSGRVVSRVLGVASSGRVLIASETTGRSRMVERANVRLVQRFTDA